MWAKLKHRIWQWRGILIAAPSVAGLVIAIRMFGWIQPLELIAFDHFLQVLPSEPVDTRIVIVGIDEKDITELEQWPMSDATLANLLSKIKQQQPRAIGLDIIRDLPIEPGYETLVKVYRSTPNLIGAEQNQQGRETHIGIAPPPVLQELGQVGDAGLLVDSDGIVRRALLSLETSDKQTVLGFGLRLALLYLDAEPGDIPHPEAINLPRFQPNDGGYINADVGGHQVLLNFRRAKSGFSIVPLRDVLADRVPKDFFRDRIVLIGATAVSLKDFFTTPLNKSVWTYQTQMSGVEIHAHIISQLLSATMNGRTPIYTWSAPLEWFWIFAWSLLGATLSWYWRQTKFKAQLTSDRPRQKRFWLTPLSAPPSALLRSVGMFTAAGILVTICYLSLYFGWWIPVAPPLLSFAGAAIAIVAYIARGAAELRTSFSRYVSDEIVALLLETPEGMKLGCERRKVTVLMCDLRGFSSISEQLPPECVVDILNIFLGEMTNVISKYRGTIDEFIGDAILVIFGAPIVREDDAERSVACAIAMQLQMDVVNTLLEQQNLPRIEMGVGINTGEVVVGNIGSQTRTKYAVVGSNVNLTSRIEAFTVGGQILISDSTLASVGELVHVNKKMFVEPKGTKHPIPIYDVGGMDGKYNLILPVRAEILYTLSEPILLYYKVLEDKYLGDNTFRGSFIRLSLDGAEIFSEQMIAPFTNIRIHLLPKIDDSLAHEVAHSVTNEDFYAKVIEREIAANTSFYVRFTTMPLSVRTFIQNLCKPLR